LSKVGICIGSDTGCFYQFDALDVMTEFVFFEGDDFAKLLSHRVTSAAFHLLKMSVMQIFTKILTQILTQILNDMITQNVNVSK
jgi:hypothetical protein